MTMMSSKKRTPRPVAAQPAQKQRRPARRPNPWNPMGPLLVGLCFGLAYVVTGRLLEDRLGGLVPLGRRFSSKPVPGLTLESLRMRYGAERVNLLGPSPQLLPEPEPMMPLCFQLRSCLWNLSLSIPWRFQFRSCSHSLKRWIPRCFQRLRLLKVLSCL